MSSIYIVFVYNDYPHGSHSFNIIQAFGSMTDALKYVSMFAVDKNRKHPQHVTVGDTVYDASIKHFQDFVVQQVETAMKTATINFVFPNEDDTSDAAQKFYQEYRSAEEGIEPDDFPTDTQYQRAVFRRMRQNQLFQEFMDKAIQKDREYTDILQFDTFSTTRIAISKKPYKPKPRSF